jgi:TolB-like protein/Flp pilus assembly protein TadD
MCFGDHTLDTGQRELKRRGVLVPIAPQCFDLLVYLLRNHDRVVSKENLIEAVWGGRAVSDSALTTRINALRRAIGDSGSEQHSIRTIARRGFRFIADLRQERQVLQMPQLGAELATASAPLSLPDEPSIGVIPFQNLGDGREQEYFAKGMVEDITTALSKLRWFFVVAPYSAFPDKDCATNVKQVGHELGVRYVLAGSVRKRRNRLRVTAQLIEAATGNHLWAERYDRDLADSFAVQDDITERVVAAIEPEVYAAENIRSRHKPPDSLGAWECVIRALSLIGKGTRNENAEAESLCRRAILLAPDCARAHSLLSWAVLGRLDWAGDVLSMLPEAREHAFAGLQLDERDPWAHLSQAVVLFRSREQGEAERGIRRALELNPNFALAHARLAHVLAAHGVGQKAIEYAEHAFRFSPVDRRVGTYATMAMAAFHLAGGSMREASGWARKTIQYSPEWPAGHAWLTAALAIAGASSEVAAARGELLRIRPGFSLAWADRNFPMTGALRDNLIEGLHRAGVPAQ